MTVTQPLSSSLIGFEVHRSLAWTPSLLPRIRVAAVCFTHRSRSSVDFFSTVSMDEAYMFWASVLSRMLARRISRPLCGFIAPATLHMFLRVQWTAISGIPHPVAVHIFMWSKLDTPFLQLPKVQRCGRTLLTTEETKAGLLPHFAVVWITTVRLAHCSLLLFGLLFLL